jgi:hypothetical protein
MSILHMVDREDLKEVLSKKSPDSGAFHGKITMADTIVTFFIN